MFAPLILLAAQAPAAAGEDQVDPGDAIIVTGERVARSRHETASSVAVVDAAALETMAYPDRIEQILQLVPNVQLGSGGEGPVIRGQDSTGVVKDLPAFLAGTRPRTTITLDGRAASYYELAFGLTSLWDLARVEVFRSPQTTTQGRNSIGGAIFVTTADPTFQWEGRARAAVGDFDTRQLSGVVSGPLAGEELAFRLSGDLRRSRSASTLTSAAEGIDPNRDDSQVVRFKLLAEPGALPGASLALSYAHGWSQMPQLEGLRPPFEARRDPAATYGIFAIRVDSLTARLGYRPGGAIEAHTTVSVGRANVQRHAPRGLGEAQILHRDLSVEPIVNWRAGAGWQLTGGLHFTRTLLDQAIALEAFPAVQGSGQFTDRQDSLGLFAEANVPLGRGLSLTGGLRRQYDRQRREGALNGRRLTVPLGYDGRFSAWLPKASLAWDIDPDTRIGVLVQRAANPGGINLNTSTGLVEVFGDESLWAYELFARVRVPHAGLSFGGNAFHYAMVDAQRTQTVSVLLPDGTAVTSPKVDNAPRAFSRGLEIDADWRILGANAAYCDAVGIQRRTLIGQSCLAFTHPEDVEISQSALRKAAAGRKGERIGFEKRYVRDDGSEIWIRSNLAKVGGHGSTARFLKIVEDITQAKATQRALEEIQNMLETLNRTGAALAAELDTEKVVQIVTDAGVELTGAAFGAFFYNVIDEQGDAMLLYALSGADRADFDQFGHPRATAVFAPTFKGEGVLRSGDITADPRYGHNAPHKGMPENHLPVRSYLAVPVTSRSGVIGGLFFGHPEAGVFTEASERLMVGLAGQAAVALDNAQLFQAAQRDNQTLEQRVEQRTRELEEANEALRQAQKMEAVGQLTGGIAHDFNNLLAGITGSLEVIERRIAHRKTEGIDRFISGAHTSAQRAAALTQRLLAFSRRQTLDPKPTDANRLVLGMEDLIHRTVGPGIKVEVVGAAGLWWTMIDQVQLESALLNLAINARDAMPDGGRLIIETANKWLDQRAGKERDLAPGQYISICVTDTGTGIPKDIADRIFDPFFTTKPIGQGTGLGLSMIHGFVRQSGGQIRVYSEAGEGTTMCLYLPRYMGEAAEEEHDPESEIVEMGAGETVLVIDDEPIVRMLIVDVVEEAGYTALEADDGPSGLKMLQATPHVALLITDVGLPGGMNGRQVADAARELQPDLKVLFVTGYAENAAISGGHLAPGMAVMTKPFVMADLAHKITELIEL